MKNHRTIAMFRMALFASVSCAVSVPVAAQTAPQAASAATTDAEGYDPNIIIITARRRDETALSTPVTVTALNARQLEVRGITTMESFARTVPTLIMGESSGSIQGGVISLRGINAGDGNVFGDQAVAFNIDGVQVARSSVRRMSSIDMAQIEVLKGPQALYYGKNSPGGIVVIHTADPTSELKARLNLGYEVVAREMRADGYISGPITDSLGFRVAGFVDDMRGWAKNVATPSATLGPKDKHTPNSREYSGRLTLKFDNGGPLTARFKLAHGYIKSAGREANNQRIDCPYGQAHHGTVTVGSVLMPSDFGTADNCKKDDKFVRNDIGTAFTGLFPAFGDGVPFLREHQTISGLELNYKLSDVLQLASQTGYYGMREQDLGNSSSGDTIYPNRVFASRNIFKIDEISQELRLSSSFEGPLNFLIGGYYQHASLYDVALSYSNLGNPTPGSVSRSTQKTNAVSAFGSLSFKPIDTLEISGGGRYSREKKDFRPFNLVGAGGVTDKTYKGVPYNPALPFGTVVPTRTFHDFSPEATISWHPTPLYTIFGSYRRGFLSGGFQTGSGNLGLDQSYKPETVAGFEGGIKGLALNRTLRFNLAAFTYTIKDQQTAVVIGATQFTGNAARSRSRGVEFDFDWTSPVKGLSMRGGTSYNQSRYTSYPGAPCYAGQTIALGCKLTGTTATQSLTGRPTVRSPDWGVFGGSTLEFETDGGSWGISTDANYSSGYYAEVTDKPASYQSGYWLVDATAFVKHGPYEFKLIGRNLTNTYYFQRSLDIPGSGATNAARTQGVFADTAGVVSRGREVTFQFSYSFF